MKSLKLKLVLLSFNPRFHKSSVLCVSILSVVYFVCQFNSVCLCTIFAALFSLYWWKLSC